MQRLHYNIKGMSCAACVAHVERAVRSVLDEKDSFTVSLLTNSLSVIPSRELDQDALTVLEGRLAVSVKAAGYELLIGETNTEKKDTVYRNNLIRLVISAVLTLAVMYLAMGGMVGLPIPAPLLGVEHALAMSLSQLLLTLPVIILNFKFFRNGFSALFHRAPNMDTLIAVGSGAAMVYGLFAIVSILLANGDHAVIHSRLHDLYFESAAMILTLVSLGKLLESRAKDKASDAIGSLATLSPKFATLLRDGKEVSVRVEEVEVGDLFLVRAGELIPVDGEVVNGSGSADESALTGESMPVEKTEGATVKAACVLTSGALTVRATNVGEDTSLARIICLLEDAASSKAPIARIADRVSAVFVPCVMSISLLTLILWLILSHNPEQALRSAISVLVISCPCALGLATPTAITVGIGRAARMGILFRNAEALEKLCSVRTVVLDKTGTVTEGRPTLTDLYAYGVDPMLVLSRAAAVERLSAHPLALAVQTAAETVSSELPEATSFESLVGVGAEATVEGVLCRVGKPDAALRRQIEEAAEKETDAVSSVDTDADADRVTIPSLSADVRKFEDRMRVFADFAALERQGKTAVLVTFDSIPVGVIGISDRVRDDSRVAVEALKNDGVTCLMLTGDNERTAAFVAQEANLDGFYASLLPEDKERMVREISEKTPCAMVGDGINDSPALVRADVGIAIGAGTEVAVDSADVVLSRSSLIGVYEARALSRATLRIIKQNLFWALFYNAICIPVAAGLFYPIFHWQLSPMLASAAMSFSSVCVVTNALRLRRIRLTPKGSDADFAHTSCKNATKNTMKNETDCRDTEFQDRTQKKGEKTEMFRKTEAQTYVIHVEGMMCPRCQAHVTKALQEVKGVLAVEVSLEAKTATVTAAIRSADVLKTAITDAGYEVVD